MDDCRDAWWESLEVLRQHASLGPATKLAFMYLWQMSGGRPGEIVISPPEMAAAFGRDPRAAHFWLRQLERWDLIAYLEHDKAKGRIHLYVFHPNPDLRIAKPDPQMALPLGFSQEPSEVIARKPPTEAPSSEVIARKPPTEGPPSEVIARKPPTEGPSSEVTAPKPPTGESLPSRESGGETPRARARPRDRSISIDIDHKDVYERSISIDRSRGREAATTIDAGDEPEYSEAAVWLETIADADRLIVRYPMFRAGARSPRNRSLFLKACYLARTEYGEDWLIDSLEAVAQVGPKNPWGYLLSCLANKARLPPAEFGRQLSAITLTMADELLSIRRAMRDTSDPEG